MNLNKSTFLLYAGKHYDNASCQSVEEFKEDLYIIRVLKINFTKHQKNGTALKERFLLNLFVSFFNVFQSTQVAGNLLFFSIQENQWTLLKTFLVYLDRCPEFVQFDGKTLDIKKIPVDEHILSSLKKL